MRKPKPQKQRGGYRPGSGRPKLDNAKVNFTVRLDPCLKTWVLSKGGGTYINATLKAIYNEEQAK